MRGRLRIESSTLAWLGLGVLLVFTAAVVLRETRDTLLWGDEWTWALYRRGAGAETFLAPHNGHLSLVPLMIYKALFATAGMTHSLPYRVMVVIGHCGCAALLYAYARRRIGPLAALLPTAVLLTLGPAWQVFLWPFQVAWLISLSAGLGVLLALDRGDRRGEIWAALLLALALASSGIGVPIAAGLVVEVIGRRRSWWVLAVPLALYALWWTVYQDSNFFRHNVVLAAQFAADAAGGSLAALAGLTEGHLDAHGTFIDAGAALDWGRPLLAAGAVLLAWRLVRLGRISVRVLALLAMAVTFWLLSGLQRVGVSSPDASRYLYVGGLLVLLIAVELLRGVRVGSEVAVVAAALTAVVVVSNLGDLRQGARSLRAQALVSRADLGALELARANVPPDYAAVRFPGVPFVTIGAKEYYAAARDFGSPALSPQEIATTPSGEARIAADLELAKIDGLLPQSSTERPGPTPPDVDAAVGGQVRTSGGCVHFRASAAILPGAITELQVTLPPSGLLLTAEGGPVSVTPRRFTPVFPSDPVARLVPGGSSVLRPTRDRAPQPWHVRLSTQAGVRACGLPPAA